MKQLIILTIFFTFSGCSYVNSCGVSSHYYNECNEYYDAMGIYHKDCGNNNISNKCSQAQDTLLEDCVNCN